MICPELRSQQNRDEWNRTLERLGGKALTETDVLNRDEYLKTLTPEQEAAYHKVYYLHDAHAGDHAEIHQHLDARDRVRAALGGGQLATASQFDPVGKFYYSEGGDLRQVTGHGKTSSGSDQVAFKSVKTGQTGEHGVQPGRDIQLFDTPEAAEIHLRQQSAAAVKLRQRAQEGSPQAKEGAIEVKPEAPERKALPAPKPRKATPAAAKKQQQIDALMETLKSQLRAGEKAAAGRTIAELRKLRVSPEAVRNITGETAPTAKTATAGSDLSKEPVVFEREPGRAFDKKNRGTKANEYQATLGSGLNAPSVILKQTSSLVSGWRVEKPQGGEYVIQDVNETRARTAAEAYLRKQALAGRAPTVRQPSATDIKQIEAKAESERPNATGLGKTQRSYLAGELQEAVKANELPTTIKVPADGEFTVYTAGQADTLHKKITGENLPAAIRRPGEAGAIAPELLGIPQMAAALKNIADTIRSGHDDIRKVFNPAARGEIARSTAEMVRHRAAEMARSIERVEHVTKDLRKIFASMTEAARWAFIDAEEHNRRQANADLEAGARLFRGIMDDDRDQVRALGTGKLEHFNENYMPRYWEKGQKVSPGVAGKAKGPLEGKKGFLKRRSYEYFMDGIDNGETPLSDNPVDFLLWKHAEMQKYVKAHENLNELKAFDMAQFARTQSAAPEGWTTPKDNLFAVWGRSEQGELILRGHYYMPEEGARIFDNYISRGLRGKTWFQGYLAASNHINQFQLGLSFFHGGFVSLDAVISNNALAIYQATRGDIGEAAKTIAKTPFAPLFYFREGRRMRQEWLEPGTHPELAPIVEAWVSGGGRANLDTFYKTSVGRQMMDAFRQGVRPGLVALMKPSFKGMAGGAVVGGVVAGPPGAVIGAALGSPVGRAIFAAVEQAARPMMAWLVPNMKAGAIASMARYELEKIRERLEDGEEIGIDEMRNQMAKVVDSVDNRMGQMIYDNLFWNKMAKDLGMASVRSLGWNLGDIREFGGGAVDVLTQVGRVGAAAGRGIAGGGGGTPGEPRGGIWNVKGPEVTHRMAYLVALPVTVGLLGGVLTWLMTGNKPTELKDYFYPKTGNLDENGDPERVSLPSYMKDIMPFFLAKGLKQKAKTAVTMAGNKLHPMLHMISEMLANKDYYGTQIRNEDDPWIQQAKDVATQLGKEMEPFGIRGVVKERERGTSWQKALLSEVGIAPAPRTLNQTAAQQEMADIMERQRPKGTRTKEEAAKYKLEAEISRGIRKGGNLAQEATAKLTDAVKSGILSKKQAQNVVDRTAQPTGVGTFKGLGVVDALRVWDMATPAERTRWKPALRDKEPQLEMLPETQREDVETRFKKALGEAEDLGTIEKIRQLKETDDFKQLDPGERKEVLRDALKSLKGRPAQDRSELVLMMTLKANRDDMEDKVKSRSDFKGLSSDQKTSVIRSVSRILSEFNLAESEKKEMSEPARAKWAESTQKALKRYIQSGDIEKRINEILRDAKRKAA